eukprot:2500785-Pyramimonas_sp.AAC.1
MPSRNHSSAAAKPKPEEEEKEAEVEVPSHPRLYAPSQDPRPQGPRPHRELASGRTAGPTTP